MTALLTTMMLLAAGFMFSACSTDDTPASSPTTPDSEIRLNADVWRMMEGTRATTFDNATALQNEAHFTCGVYEANSTTPYIGPIQVDWDNSNWVFSDGKHYWPESGNLDFFAYMPATKPDYITGITYAVNGTPAPAPYFTCDMSQTINKEFIYALTPGQNRTNAAAGVTMTFKHPFAKVTFKKNDGATYTVNSVSIGSFFYQTGTCTFDGTVSTWSGQSETVSPLFTFDEPILVIPSNYGSQTITANVTWSDWSNVSKNLTASATFDLVAGYSYIYTISVNKDKALIVDAEKYTEQW